jgi:lipoprotein-releasing system permease protein
VKKFSPLALGVALALFAGAFGAQIALRTWLGARTLFSSDAVLGLSFGAEAVLFLVSGFVISFVGRGAAVREQLGAAALLGVGSFFALRKIKPPSFSYDHFFATDPELFILAAVTCLAAFLLGLWGASFGLLVGAGRHTDLSFSYEAGIARTHLRLTRGTLARIVWIGLSVAGGFFGAGVIGSWLQGARDILAWQWALGLGGLCLLLALIVDRVLQRLRDGKLLPGQKKRRPATVVMTFISIAGVAVGVTALTVVLSVMSGFEADLKKKILGTNAHAMLLKYTNDFSEWQKVLPQVTAVPGVTGASPFILNEVMIAHKEALTGSELKGIDPATVGSVSELPKQTIAGELSWISDPSKIPVGKVVSPREGINTENGGPDVEQYLEDVAERRKNHPEESAAAKLDPEALAKMPGICIGKEMSHQLRVWIGDPVNIITPLGESGPTGIVPRSKTFRVACILYSGMYEYDMKFAYISIAEAQSFFRLKDNITGLELKFADVDAARANGRRIVAALKGFPYRAKDWSELNRNLFSALKLEKLAMAIILTFIVLVACFNILSTLIMLVLEKTKEISILKSMGARDASIMKIFVVEGVTIGALGTGIGLLVGLSLCSFIERFGLRLDPDVYYISNLPVTVEPGQFGLVAAIALCLTYLATLYPAIKASHLSPVDGLREE